MVVNTVTKPNSKSDSANVLNNVFVNVPSAAPERPELKSCSALKILIRLQLVLAVLIIVFESIKFGVIFHILQFPAYGVCMYGTGWWVGLFGVITAGLGFGAFRTSRGHKCLMISHFVMGVVTIVADGVLIALTGICISQLQYRFSYYYHDYRRDERGDVTDATSMDTNFKGLTANESLLLIAVVTHFVSSIVSSAFICRNMCGSAQPPITLVYMPPGAADGHEQANNTGGITCQVKPGTQVFFMPNAGGTRQQNDFSPAVKSS